MVCIDCGKEAKKLRVGVMKSLTDFGYVCRECWKSWAPFMHKFDCDCPHCVWGREAIRDNWRTV